MYYIAQRYKDNRYYSEDKPDKHSGVLDNATILNTERAVEFRKSGYKILFLVPAKEEDFDGYPTFTTMEYPRSKELV